jgi:hypothetical protein
MAQFSGAEWILNTVSRALILANVRFAERLAR